ARPAAARAPGSAAAPVANSRGRRAPRAYAGAGVPADTSWRPILPPLGHRPVLQSAVRPYGQRRPANASCDPARFSRIGGGGIPAGGRPRRRLERSAGRGSLGPRAEADFDGPGGRLVPVDPVQHAGAPPAGRSADGTGGAT